MGVVRWLDRIDPARWTTACQRLTSSPPDTRAAAARFLEELGGDGDHPLLEDFDDLHEDRDLLPSLLNGLLEAAVKEESWELDKSLGHGFQRLPALIPALKPLRKIIDFSGLDHDLPRACIPDESGGLFGCISPENLADCRAGVEQLPTAADVAAALRRVKPGIVSRALGRGDAAADLATHIEDTYFATYWTNLGRALGETARRGHLLGLGMAI